MKRLVKSGVTFVIKGAEVGAIACFFFTFILMLFTTGPLEESLASLCADQLDAMQLAKWASALSEEYCQPDTQEKKLPALRFA